MVEGTGYYEERGKPIQVVHKVSVEIIDNMVILLNSITLLAVMGGNEVTNPFMVTELYVKENGKWKLGSLSFTKLLVPEDTKH